MAQAAQSEVGNTSAVREGIAGALARILASPTFARSPRLREFLAFVCERVVQNREAEINETEIATHVFGRPPDSPLSSEDTIVRSSARHLRAKLKEYYEKEGAAETLLVEIPTGSYVPVIRNRIPLAQPAASPVVAIVESPPSAPKSPEARLVRVLGALCAIFFAAAVWFYATGRPGRKVAAAIPVPDNILRHFLLKPSQQTYIVAADTALVVRQDMLGRQVTIEEYTSADGPDPRGAAWARNPELLSFWKNMSHRQYTSFADLTTYERILRQNADFLPQITLRHARSLAARDFSSGNFVFLGSEQSVPWLALFREHLNFRFAPFHPGQTSAVYNTAPRPGEQREYADSGSEGTRRQLHALLTLSPNLAHTGNVLMVSGSSREATEAAGLFALSPASLRALAEKGGEPAKIESFELLLRIGAIQGAPYDDPVVEASRITLKPM